MREFRDPYLHTMMEIEAAAEYTDAEKAALIQQVIDALHLAEARRPFRGQGVTLPSATAGAGKSQRLPLRIRWTQNDAGVCCA